MNHVTSFLRTINQQLGYITSQMETPHWVCLSAVILVIGFFMMRGNVLRGA